MSPRGVYVRRSSVPARARALVLQLSLLASCEPLSISAINIFLWVTVVFATSHRSQQQPRAYSRSGAPAAVGVSDTTARSKRRNNKRWWRNAVGAASRAGRNHGLLPQTYVYLAKKSKNIRGKVGTSENSRIGCERRELGVKDSSGVNWAACITVTRPCRRSMSWTGCAGDFCRCGAFEAA